MNFIFISPNFPYTYWQFCDRLKKNGVNVLGIGDSPYYELGDNLKNSLNEYYKVNSLENYEEVYKAVEFFTNKYGKIDWIESNNEYWLYQDARLRSAFDIKTGILFDEISNWKQKSKMKAIYKNANIPSAAQIDACDKEKVKIFIKEFNYPIILKPDVGVGASNTWKIENDSEFEKFYNLKPDIPYVVEEFIDADLCSYDAIVDSKSNPIFESMTVWPPSIADIVNKGYDLYYYVSADMPDSLRNLGRKTLKAFNVKSRFIHFEFFKLNKPYKNIGNIGDFAALEVNMRPAGGYTPDMIDFAHSVDVYKIWADMVTYDKSTSNISGKNFYCVYAGRKPEYNYKHSHEEILKIYGNNIKMCERMPRLMWDTMGCQMYTVNLENKNEITEFIEFVHKRI